MVEMEKTLNGNDLNSSFTTKCMIINLVIVF